MTQKIPLLKHQSSIYTVSETSLNIDRDLNDDLDENLDETYSLEAKEVGSYKSK